MTATEPTELTAEELTEFTLFNALAFDIHRSASKAADTIPPFWLCTSVEARLEIQREAYPVLAQQLMLVVNTPEQAERALRKILGPSKADGIVDQWRRFETEAKQRRAEGDPLAFFCPNRQ